MNNLGNWEDYYKLQEFEKQKFEKNQELIQRLLKESRK